jgi:hypothetical protein
MDGPPASPSPPPTTTTTTINTLPPPALTRHHHDLHQPVPWPQEIDDAERDVPSPRLRVALPCRHLRPQAREVDLVPIDEAHGRVFGPSRAACALGRASGGIAGAATAVAATVPFERALEIGCGWRRRARAGGGHRTGIHRLCVWGGIGSSERGTKDPENTCSRRQLGARKMVLEYLCE